MIAIPVLSPLHNCALCHLVMYTNVSADSNEWHEYMIPEVVAYSVKPCDACTRDQSCDVLHCCGCELFSETSLYLPVVLNIIMFILDLITVK